MEAPFYWRTPRPMTIDYSDGSCKVYTLTRLAVFVWGKDLTPANCGPAPETP